MTNMKRMGRFAAAILLCLAVQGSALAWGPQAQTAIVTTAARILSEQNNIPLVRLERDIRSGASISDQEVELLIPGAYTNLEQTIESQMFLLQGVRSDRIDPYMAYRLGVLGKLVAQYTAPMAEADPTFRNLYYADVDKNIQNTRLSSSKRRTVDTEIYLSSTRRQAQARQDLIVRDYRQGVGFGGVAKGSLSQEASRSVDAVADVWYTVFSGGGAVGGISNELRQEYLLRSFDFYLKRKNPQETKQVYQKLTESGEISPEMHKRMGDLYYEAGRFEDAMQEYRTVLSTLPNRKDVIEKVAAYYIQKGDEAVKEDRLEDAVEAYRVAQETDLGNAAAQTKRNETEARISERTSSLEKARQAITQAQTLEQQADQLRLQGNYGEAMDALSKAQQLYRGVPQEFEAETLAAQRGLTNIEIRTRELKGLLVQNTDRLSGTAFGVEARRLAASTAPNLNQKAFQELLGRGYQEEIERLKQEMRSRMADQPTQTVPAPKPGT